MMLYGLFIVALGGTTNYFLALVFWAAASGFGLFLNINTVSLRQAIVPSHLMGRVASIAGVLAWSAIPAGTLLGGAVINALGQDRVGWVYSAIGVLIFGLAVFFRLFTALGHAEHYLEEPEPQLEDRRLAPDAPDLA